MVTVTVGSDTYECTEADQVIDISASTGTTGSELLCPVRPDVFCGDPKRGKYEFPNPYGLFRDWALRDKVLAQPWENLRIKYDFAPSYQYLTQTTKDWLTNEILAPT